MLPRHLDIIFEINLVSLYGVRAKYPGDEGRVERVSLIEGGPTKQVRMAKRGIVGVAQHQRRRRNSFAAAAHSNGQGSGRSVSPAVQQQDQWRNAATLASDVEPLAFANHHRRHRRRLDYRFKIQLKELKPLANDQAFQNAFQKGEPSGQVAICRLAQAGATGEAVNPDSIFDCHIKRIHEYKRQLLNALRMCALQSAAKESEFLDMPPRTFFFSGKAAPAYQLAKVHYQVHQQSCRHH